YIEQKRLKFIRDLNFQYHPEHPTTEVTAQVLIPGSIPVKRAISQLQMKILAFLLTDVPEVQSVAQKIAHAPQIPGTNAPGACKHGRSIQKEIPQAIQFRHLCAGTVPVAGQNLMPGPVVCPDRNRVAAVRHTRDGLEQSFSICND